jgi:hypothetical protein
MHARFRAPLLLAALALAGCDTHPTSSRVDTRAPGRPTDVRVRYEWILEGWTAQGRPVGRPSVIATWKLPRDWSGEPFRVYARRSTQGSYSLVATVTSCEGGVCRYQDVNVVHGSRYEYYVASVDQSTGRETVSDVRDVADVPAFAPPAAPQPDSSVGLDGSAYLRWKGVGGGTLWKYLVFLVGIDHQTYLYQLGEADAPGFLDLRAKNGHVYRYRVAAMDTLGHVSPMSGPMSAIPRPDFRGELLYAHGDSASRSGFQFVRSDSLSPVLAGDAAGAQWRFEVVNGVWQIRPLRETEVLDAGRTTALVCGPGSDPGCRAVNRAPASGYTRDPVPAHAEVSYVFRVRGSDGRVHYGVVRPQLLGSDQQGKRLVILDWAYQLVPDEPRLLRTGS